MYRCSRAKSKSQNPSPSGGERGENILTHFLCLFHTCQGQPFVGPRRAKATSEPQRLTKQQIINWPVLTNKCVATIQAPLVGYNYQKFLAKCIIPKGLCGLFDGWHELQVSSKGWWIPGSAGGIKTPNSQRICPLFVQSLLLKSWELTNLQDSFKIKRLGLCNFQDLIFQSWTKKSTQKPKRNFTSVKCKVLIDVKSEAVIESKAICAPPNI